LTEPWEEARKSEVRSTTRGGRKRRSWLKLALRWLALLFMVSWIAIPFLVTISASLKTRGAVFADPSIIPTNPTFDSYREVLSRPGFRTAFVNSVILGFGTCGLTLVLAVPAAYAFARFGFRFRHLLLLFVLLPRLVPGVALLLPLYRLAAELGVLNSRGTLIVVYSGGLLPLAIWLLMGFFQQIPREVEEAATVDGATLLQRQRFVVLPLAVPALITVGVLAFREAWNEFQLPLVLATSQDARPLPFELYNLKGLNLSNLPGEAAFALLTILPLAFVYVRIERYVVQGMVSGSTR
jgi:ABC-type glycerol-3-phosphate transport system permease component